MDRRAFLGSLTGGLLAAPLAVEAQTARKPWRIGWLDQGSGVGGGPGMAAFRDGLKELGYAEGRQYVMELRHATGEPNGSQRSQRNWWLSPSM